MFGKIIIPFISVHAILICIEEIGAIHSISRCIVWGLSWPFDPINPNELASFKTTITINRLVSKCGNYLYKFSDLLIAIIWNFTIQIKNIKLIQ